MSMVSTNFHKDRAHCESPALTKSSAVLQTLL